MEQVPAAIRAKQAKLDKITRQETNGVNLISLVHKAIRECAIAESDAIRTERVMAMAKLQAFGQVAADVLGICQTAFEFTITVSETVRENDSLAEPSYKKWLDLVTDEIMAKLEWR